MKRKRNDPTIESPEIPTAETEISSEITEAMAQRMLAELGVEPEPILEQPIQARAKYHVKKTSVWQINTVAAKQSEWAIKK